MTAASSLRPAWAGDDWLSRLVNALIATRPLYALMKQQARRTLIRTAERKGVAWRETVEDLQQQGLDLPSRTADYPDYYQVPFHAYDEGNLCWLAAYEAEPATYSMALRIWPDEDLTWEQAQERLRASFHQQLAEHGPETVNDVLDLGCSVGISTRPLREFYRQRQGQAPRTVGLDLSPYMLAVARHRDPAGAIEWRQGLAEDTGLPEASFDLITLQFVLHELPNRATEAIAREALRLLRPGGCLAIVDNNPGSEVIRNLPPVLFTLMKSTEPWSDEYYPLDVEGLLQRVGFALRCSVESDPRHRTIIVSKP
jgi:SAM-dependent methyltransferase